MKNAPDITKRIGYRIRIMRDMAGLTQQELADKAGISRSFLTRIENGTVEASLSSLQQVADALEVSMGQIIGDIPIAERPEARALALLQSAVAATKGVPVPLIGRVPADALRWAEWRDDGRTVNVPTEWAESRDLGTLFVLEVSGDCMLAQGIPSGSFVLCEKPNGAQPSNGDAVVVRIGQEYTLKLWHRVGARIELRDGDGQVIARLSPTDDAEVVGVVLYSWKQRHQ